MSFITQFKIEFLLPFNGCRKVLGKMPAPHTQAHSFLMISGGIDVINLLKFCYILQAKFGGDPFYTALVSETKHNKRNWTTSKKRIQ